jgi:hypothetical protein
VRLDRAVDERQPVLELRLPELLAPFDQIVAAPDVVHQNVKVSHPLEQARDFGEHDVHDPRRKPSYAMSGSALGTTARAIPSIRLSFAAARGPQTRLACRPPPCARTTRDAPEALPHFARRLLATFSSLSCSAPRAVAIRDMIERSALSSVRAALTMLAAQRPCSWQPAPTGPRAAALTPASARVEDCASVVRPSGNCQ